MTTEDVGCPNWCNREHKPGGNPRRQVHEHKFRPGDRRESTKGWISFYPAPSWGFKPCGMLTMSGYGTETHFVLTLDDVRAYIADLEMMADILEAAQSRVDLQKFRQELYA